MFEQTLKRVVRKLAAAQKKKLLNDFALIGGLAVSRWSIPRATFDIDFVIAAAPGKLAELAKFLKAKYRLGSPRDSIMSCVYFEVKDRIGPIPVQLLEFPPAWTEISFVDVVSEKIGSTKIPIVDWKALVLLKLYAGGPLDMQDATQIMQTVKSSSKEIVYLRSKAQSLRVSRKLEKVLP